MLLCDSFSLSDFPVYFTSTVVLCEEIQDFHPCFLFAFPAKFMTPANSIFPFICLQFWFRFWTLWEFIEL